jgi:GMP synthase (glutamine-hydrolysing)
MTKPLRFLVAESEPPRARRERRESVGKSSGETYIDVLQRLAPGAEVDRVKPADDPPRWPQGEALDGYDAAFLTGSPLHLYQDTAEARREIAFMRAVFEAGVPAFGSCAGLQVATVAAGGAVRAMSADREVAFARRITPTSAGADHPLLAGRPSAYDAPAIHSDEVDRLPDGATLLASNRVTRVQAAEIRHARGVFWGVQYHPEISLQEVAAAVRRQADDLLSQSFADSRDTLAAHAELIEALGRQPDRRDLAWRLGLDEQVTDPALRTLEIRNFIERLVKPTRSERGRE